MGRSAHRIVISWIVSVWAQGSIIWGQSECEHGSGESRPHRKLSGRRRERRGGRPTEFPHAAGWDDRALYNVPGLARWRMTRADEKQERDEVFPSPWRKDLIILLCAISQDGTMGSVNANLWCFAGGVLMSR